MVITGATDLTACSTGRETVRLGWQPKIGHTVLLRSLACTKEARCRALELWRDGNRFFLVADDEDALEAMKRFGARRG